MYVLFFLKPAAPQVGMPPIAMNAVASAAGAGWAALMAPAAVRWTSMRWRRSPRWVAVS